MILRTIRIHAVFLSLALVFLAACAGPREATDPVEDADELPTPEVQMSDYEDFDSSTYTEPPPGADPGIEHDVPASLMEGRADSGVESNVRGFRVQVFQTLDKNSAVDLEEDAKAWWSEVQEEAPPGLLGDDMAISVVYMQPYYRVRIGNFTSRDAAERARSYLTRRFPDAFIVPDTITVTR